MLKILLQLMADKFSVGFGEELIPLHVYPLKYTDGNIQQNKVVQSMLR